MESLYKLTREQIEQKYQDMPIYIVYTKSNEGRWYIEGGVALTRAYNIYDSYYLRAATKRIMEQKRKFKMLLQKLAGVIILLMCGLMLVIAFKDYGNTDITAVLLFLPIGICSLCLKRKL